MGMLKRSGRPAGQAQASNKKKSRKKPAGGKGQGPKQPKGSSSKVPRARDLYEYEGARDREDEGVDDYMRVRSEDDEEIDEENAFDEQDEQR